MNNTSILIIYEYNYWANAKIIATSALVTPEQFAAHNDSSYGSLRGTILHLLDAEKSWRLLCQHNQMTFDLKEADYPTLDAIVKEWRVEEKEMRAYIATLNDDALNGFIRYTLENGTKRERVLWHCLYHVVNHQTQHRAEAAAMLTAFGQSPGDFDFTLFLNEWGQRK